MNKRTSLFRFLAMLALQSSLSIAAMAGSDITAEQAAQNTPEGWTPVELPEIAAITDDNTYDITAYGASTTRADNSDAIQSAIDKATGAGGMVLIPAGTWLTGPITMKSNVVLHLAAGATLKALPYGTYPSENGAQDHTGKYLNLINSGSSIVRNVIIEGEGETSVIDGQGAPWWADVETYGSFTRPSLIRLEKGTCWLFRNFKCLNSPGTNITVGRSGNGSHATLHDITIENPASTLGKGKASHNTDGIPVWGPYVNIYDCYISTGDDNVVVDSNGRYVHAWNITCGSGHGMSIGSFTANVHDIIYEDIRFYGTETGFRIKTQRGRSGNSMTGSNGAVRNIVFRNSYMNGVGKPIYIDCFYSGKPSTPAAAVAEAVTADTPEYRDILIQNVKGENIYGNPLYIYGLPESYVHDLTFDNVRMSSSSTIFMAFCRDVSFTGDCQFTSTKYGSKIIDTQYEATYTGNYNTAYMLSTSTYGSSTAEGNAWQFSDGGKSFAVTNSNGKTYSASGNTQFVKYSAGVDFTVSVPDGLTVREIAFTGFDNYDTEDSYIASVNGKPFAATDYVFPKDKNWYTHYVKLDEPATGSVTFTIGGKQTCLAIALITGDDPTGIATVPERRASARNGKASAASPVKYIDVSGRLLIGDFNALGQRVK